MSMTFMNDLLFFFLFFITPQNKVYIKYSNTLANEVKIAFNNIIIVHAPIILILDEF